MQDVGAKEGTDNVRPLQVQNARGRLRHLTLGSADWQELLQTSSVGEGTLHELLGQVSDTAGCRSLGQGTHMGGRSVHEQPEPEMEPSPLMHWTSDGSMMEELLKTFTPGTPTAAAGPVSQSQNALAKDVSISSALLALIAQQEEENAAAEKQNLAGVLASGVREGTGTHSRQAQAVVKMEDGGSIDRPPCLASPVAAAGIAGCPSKHGASAHGHGTTTLQGPGPAQLMLLQNDLYLQPEAAPPASLVAVPSYQSDSSAPSFKGSGPQLHPRPPAKAGYLKAGAKILSGHGLCPHPVSLQPLVPGGTMPSIQEGHCSGAHSSTVTALPCLRPLSAPNYSCHDPKQPLTEQPLADGRGGIESGTDEQSRGAMHYGAFPCDSNRPASAPLLQQQHALAMGYNQLPGRLLGEGPEQRAAGTVRTFYATAQKDVGVQLAAEFMREAVSLHSEAVLTEPPLVSSPQAFLHGPCGHMRPLFVAAPAPGVDADAEPPAVLTAGISARGQLLRDDASLGAAQHGSLSPPAPDFMDVEPLRGKRERSSMLQRPPAGPKRSAVGLPPARAVSTEPDDDEDSDGGSSHAERGQGTCGAAAAAGYIDEREAKKQLRKEKNRASAAASRARREAYTASLEEEVAKLKEGQNWLESQVNAPEVAVAMPTVTRVPVRHLSI